MKEQDLGHGNKIVGFESFEEMQEYMASNEEEANQDVMPEQLGVTWGGYAIRAVEGDLFIWGRIDTMIEYARKSRLAGATADEAIYELESVVDSHQRGYRYGTWYSEVCPEGEIGSAHVVSLWPISKEDFEMAQRNDWHVWPEFVLRLTVEVNQATANEDSRRKEQNDE